MNHPYTDTQLDAVRSDPQPLAERLEGNYGNRYFTPPPIQIVAAQRIRALEAACRKMGKELAGWRCGGLLYMNGAPGYGASSIGVSKLRYHGCSVETNKDPLAAKFIEEARNG